MRGCAPRGRASGVHVVQLAGCEARWMAEGARIAEASGAAIIDINMGCPARHVTGGQSGSALMRDLDHALSLDRGHGRRVSGAGDAQDAARLGRPLDQRARARAPRRGGGRAADHRAWPHPLPVLQGPRRLGGGARRQGRASTIPVVVNGDIRSCDDAVAALAASGADAVMVGRAAQGRPWLPGQIARYLASGRREAAPALATQFALDRCALRRDARPPRRRDRPPPCAQASRLGARCRGRDRGRGRGAAQGAPQPGADRRRSGRGPPPSRRCLRVPSSAVASASERKAA